jgi:phosphate transport system substrate-binding protein
MSKNLRFAALSVVVLSTLTACDPPIPQSILVARAEQEVQCGEPGEVSIYADYGFADLGTTWTEMLSSACPEIATSASEAASAADLVVSSLAAPCEPIASAPVAFDAAAIVFYLDEAFALNLSSATIQGIFSGVITNWSDKAIAADNPEVAFPDLEITVQPESHPAAIEAMQRWTAQLTGQEVAFTKVAPAADVVLSDLYFEFMPGTIALIPMSDALIAGATPANVVKGDGSIVVPEQQTLYSASTMFGFTEEDAKVTATFDQNIEPHPSPGTSEVAVPYEAMYPINLNICGEDNLTKRAVARYVVRLDAQGVVATSSVFGVDENLRVASATVLGTGLPQPDMTDLSE